MNRRNDGDRQLYEQIRASLAAAYDRSAAAREAQIDDIQPWKRRVRADFLAALLREGKKTLLEIGSGPGRDGLFFQEAGLIVTCTDNSEEMVRLCQAKGLRAEVMDFLNLDFPAASFDAVFALNSLLHVPKRALPLVLETIQRLLKRDGLFFYGVYGGMDYEGISPQDWHDPPRFFARYTDASLQAAVTPWFEVLYFTPVPIPGGQTYHFQAMHLRPRSLAES